MPSSNLDVFSCALNLNVFIWRVLGRFGQWAPPPSSTDGEAENLGPASAQWDPSGSDSEGPPPLIDELSSDDQVAGGQCMDEESNGEQFQDMGMDIATRV